MIALRDQTARYQHQLKRSCLIKISLDSVVDYRVYTVSNTGIHGYMHQQSIIQGAGYE